MPSRLFLSAAVVGIQALLLACDDGEPGENCSAICGITGPSCNSNVDAQAACVQACLAQARVAESAGCGELHRDVLTCCSDEGNHGVVVVCRNPERCLDNCDREDGVLECVASSSAPNDPALDEGPTGACEFVVADGSRFEVLCMQGEGVTEARCEYARQLRNISDPYRADRGFTEGGSCDSDWDACPGSTLVARDARADELDELCIAGEFYLGYRDAEDTSPPGASNVPGGGGNDAGSGGSDGSGGTTGGSGGSSGGPAMGRICEWELPVEQGAAARAAADYLCDDQGESLHALAASDSSIDLLTIADDLGVGIVSLSVDDGAEFNYGWVDEELIGQIPNDTLFGVQCTGCGKACDARKVIVLSPGEHALRIEGYESQLCTRYYNQSSVVCGADFDPEASMVGCYSGSIQVSQGTCDEHVLSLSDVCDGGGNPDDMLMVIDATVDGSPIDLDHIEVNMDARTTPTSMRFGASNTATGEWIWLYMPSLDFDRTCSDNSSTCSISYYEAVGSAFDSTDCPDDSHEVTVTLNDGTWLEGSFSSSAHDSSFSTSNCDEPPKSIEGTFRIRHPESCPGTLCQQDI